MLAHLLGLAAAALTTLCWLPQAIRSVTTRDTRAISLPFQLLQTSGVVLWLNYGLLIGDVPLILANVVTLALCCVVLVAKLRFG